MGGRGSSSKRYDLLHKDKPYGTEYTCLYKEGRYEILQYNGGKQSKAPMETRTKRRDLRGSRQRRQSRVHCILR